MKFLADLIRGVVDMATVTKTIGTASRDYSTITGWEVDLDDTLIYSSGDDIIGECYNDTVFNDRFSLGETTISKNSVTLTAATGERHDGTLGTGVEVYWDASPGVVLGDLSVTSHATVEWIIFDTEYIATTLDASYSIRVDVSNYRIFNCIFNKKRRNKSIGTPKGIYEYLNGALIANNIIQYWGRTSGVSYTPVSGYAIRKEHGNNNSQYFNNTIWDNYYGISVSGTANTDVRNNISQGTALSAYHGTITTEDYNIADDTTTTGTNSINSVSASSLFVSTVFGSEDLHIKEGCAAQDAGVDLGSSPDGIQYDIDGLDRTLIDSWDIGADEIGLPIFNFNSATSAVISASVTYPETARLFISGPPTYSESKNLYTAGPIVFSNDQENEPLFVSGPNPTTVNINTFTAGPYPSSGIFPARIISGGEPNEGTTLYVQSPLSDGGGGDIVDVINSLYIKGTTYNVDTSNGMPIYLEVPIKASYDDDVSLFIQTRSEFATDNSGVFPTYIGVDPAITTEAGAEILTTQAVAFVSGSNVSMVYEGINTNSTMFIESRESYNEDFDLFIRCPKADAMTAFVYNYETDDNNFSITVDGGGIPNSGNFSMFVSPPTAKTLNIHMNGYLE